MSRQSFERSREKRWRAFEQALENLERRRATDLDVPREYRLICQDLALAQERQLGPALVDRLNELALRGHNALYAGPRRRARPVHYLTSVFPRAVRREWRLHLLTSGMLYGTAALLFGLDWLEPDLVYQLLDGPKVDELEAMYDPGAEHFGAAREASGNLSAFGFYIRNNIGIAFRTFAGGIFFGLGSVFFLVFNGAYLGLAASHLTQLGYGGTFYPFIVGHGAFELTAFALAGVAGLRMGLALVAPGNRARSDALRRAASGALPILYGFMAMLVLAAMIEAFWSGLSSVTAGVKIVVGLVLWAVVGAWLGLGGRARAA